MSTSVIEVDIPFAQTANVTEDSLSVEGLILGRPSLERPESFRKWLAARTA